MYIYTYIFDTAGVMQTVPLMYILLINTIYLSYSTQVAWGTVFRKHTRYVWAIFVENVLYCNQTTVNWSLINVFLLDSK